MRARSHIIMYMCVMCILSVYVFVCTQVTPHSGLFVYNYVYVCYVHFICLCVCTKSAVAGVAPHLGICA